jgi:hypothetical protein
MSHEKIDVVRPEQIVSVGLVMVVAPAKCPAMEELGRWLPQWARTFALPFRWNSDGLELQAMPVSKINWLELQATTKTQRNSIQ